MKRVLFVLLGLTVAMTAFGLLMAFSRPIKWPRNIGSPDVRRTLGEEAGRAVEEAAA